MLACGIDFETQGVRPGTDRATEIGIIIFRAEDFMIAAQENALLWEEGYPPQPDKIIEVTGITDEMLINTGMKPAEVFTRLVDRILEEEIGCFVAHNAPFDKGFFRVEIEKLRGQVADEKLDKILAIPWVCTMRDIKHPEKFKCRKLSHLALDYGVPVDPNQLHRADQDVLLMIAMIAKAKVNISSMIGYSQTPDVIIRACVPSPFGPNGDGGTGKEKAKLCGFSWQKVDGSPEYKNCWVKKVKENEIEKEKEALGYEVKIVEKG